MAPLSVGGVFRRVINVHVARREYNHTLNDDMASASQRIAAGRYECR